MPVLRFEIASYIRTWNSHSIRKQKNRPFSVSGKPYMNYNHPSPGVSDHGLEFDEELLVSLQDNISDWGKFIKIPRYYYILTYIIDPDKYLPYTTYQWTLAQLLELGFNPRKPPVNIGDDNLSPYYRVYLNLRVRIQAHIQDNAEPVLALSRPPLGSFNWEPVLNQNIPEIEVEYDTEAQANPLTELRDSSLRPGFIETN